MPAKRDFHHRCEPAKMPGFTGFMHEKGGLRDIVLEGDLLEKAVGEEFGKNDDAGRITEKGGISEGINLVEWIS